jgi:hypothetical protein
MRLLTLLVLRLTTAVLLCLTIAIAGLVWEAHRSIEADVSATAARVDQRLKTLYWQHLMWRNGISRGSLMPLPDWDTIETQSIISPGICVTFGLTGKDPRKLCSQVEVLGPPAPACSPAFILRSSETSRPSFGRFPSTGKVPDRSRLPPTPKLHFDGRGAKYQRLWTWRSCWPAASLF